MTYRRNDAGPVLRLRNRLDGSEALLVLAPLEPWESAAAARRLSGLHSLAPSSPGIGGLAEVDDGVLGWILRQHPGPRRDQVLDLVPARPQRLFAQPLADLEASLELADGPVVGEPGVAGVLAEQGFLFGCRFQADAV